MEGPIREADFCLNKCEYREYRNVFQMSENPPGADKYMV